MRGITRLPLWLLARCLVRWRETLHLFHHLKHHVDEALAEIEFQNDLILLEKYEIEPSNVVLKRLKVFDEKPIGFKIEDQEENILDTFKIEIDESMIDINESVIDNNEPMIDNNEPIIDDNEPIIDNNEPIIDINEPIIDIDETKKKINDPLSIANDSMIRNLESSIHFIYDKKDLICDTAAKSLNKKKEWMWVMDKVQNKIYCIVQSKGK